MGNSAIKQHYDTAHKTGVFKLSQQKLTEFPVRLFELKSVLRTLDLSENKIILIPPDIGLFENLKHLKLNKNRISALPENICKLKKLESLSVCDNELKGIPNSFSQLAHLKQVHLSGNNLSEFPIAFRGLKMLDLLDLSRNKITCVPDEVIQIHAVEIILNQNQISSLSEQIAGCPRLKTLRLEENCLQLSAIPPKVLKDSNISILTLDGNLFEMKNLAQIDGYDDYMERYTAVKKKMF
ncbi:UNVERIFIED_CONTAM: hypothetical protein PYX00_003329 [Menopon gallinae]|uniref:Leucine-rich repeat-containing protein 57 n=1 Tax=Menopon gallinae TaxID=328185 RepID=A0AAW2I0D1_9NEOP